MKFNFSFFTRLGLASVVALSLTACVQESNPNVTGTLTVTSPLSFTKVCESSAKACVPKMGTLAVGSYPARVYSVIDFDSLANTSQLKSLNIEVNQAGGASEVIVFSLPADFKLPVPNLHDQENAIDEVAIELNPDSIATGQPLRLEASLREERETHQLPLACAYDQVTTNDLDIDVYSGSTATKLATFSGSSTEHYQYNMTKWEIEHGKCHW